MTRRLRYLQKLQQCLVHRVYQRFQSDVAKKVFFGTYLRSICSHVPNVHHEFGKCRFFGGDRLWHTQVYVLLPDEQKRHLHQHHGVKLLEDPAEESAGKALRGAIFGGTWNDGVNKFIEMAPLSKIVQIFLTWGRRISILQILTMLPLNCHYPLNIKNAWRWVLLSTVKRVVCF